LVVPRRGQHTFRPFCPMAGHLFWYHDTAKVSACRRQRTDDVICGTSVW